MSEKALFSRLDDRSLEAYKAWINGIIKHVTGKEGGRDSLTEEEWREGWRKFWVKVDAARERKEGS